MRPLRKRKADEPDDADVLRDAAAGLEPLPSAKKTGKGTVKVHAGTLVPEGVAEQALKEQEAAGTGLADTESTVGVPPLDVPYDVPTRIPKPGPGEVPDRADDTANVPLDILTWLMCAKAVLLAEGFRREPLRQARKPGMVWGIVRQEPDHMQIHVRAFKDGRLETEVELSNRYIQHLWSHRRSAHAEVKEILERHRMPTERVSETFVPITGSHAEKKMPRGRTPVWKIALPVAIGIGVLLGRRYLRRRALRKK